MFMLNKITWSNDVLGVHVTRTVGIPTGCRMGYISSLFPSHNGTSYVYQTVWQARIDYQLNVDKIRKDVYIIHIVMDSTGFL